MIVIIGWALVLVAIGFDILRECRNTRILRNGSIHFEE